MSGSATVMPQDMAISRFGDVVELTCSAQGGPGNQFSWTADGEAVANTPQFNQNINNASDGGLYQCRVENQAGFDTAEVIINGNFNIKSLAWTVCIRNNCQNLFQEAKQFNCAVRY